MERIFFGHCLELLPSLLFTDVARLPTHSCFLPVRLAQAFFALWGMHVSSSEVLNPWVADELANLPRWMPNFDFDPALLLEDDG